MTRDEVCQEFGAWYQGEIPEEVHWRAAENMADEIVRLRAILAALREPSDAVVEAFRQAYVKCEQENEWIFTHSLGISEAISAAVAAAEWEVTP